MKAKQLLEIDARIRVLSTTLQEVCRALPRSQTAAVAEYVRCGVAALAIEACPSRVDEAIARELAPLLAALTFRPTPPPSRHGGTNGDDGFSTDAEP